MEKLYELTESELVGLAAYIRDQSRLPLKTAVSIWLRLNLEKTMVKPFADGTKEELIAHFTASAKAWEYINASKDKEISDLKKTLKVQAADIRDLMVMKNVEAPMKLKNENTALKRNFESWKHQLVEEVEDFLNSLRQIAIEEEAY